MIVNALRKILFIFIRKLETYPQFILLIKIKKISPINFDRFGHFNLLLVRNIYFIHKDKNY
jgi:hypothetical protein